MGSRNDTGAVKDAVRRRCLAVAAVVLAVGVAADPAQGQTGRMAEAGRAVSRSGVASTVAQQTAGSVAGWAANIWRPGPCSVVRLSRSGRLAVYKNPSDVCDGRSVDLEGDYGLMVMGAEPRSEGRLRFLLFSQPDKKVAEAADEEALKRLLAALPEGVKVDFYDTCTEPLCGFPNTNRLNALLDYVAAKGQAGSDFLICTCAGMAEKRPWKGVWRKR